MCEKIGLVSHLATYCSIVRDTCFRQTCTHKKPEVFSTLPSATTDRRRVEPGSFPHHIAIKGTLLRTGIVPGTFNQKKTVSTKLLPQARIEREKEISYPPAVFCSLQHASCFISWARPSLEGEQNTPVAVCREKSTNSSFFSPPITQSPFFAKVDQSANWEEPIFFS